MASSINASLTAGVVTTADTSGVLQLQTAGVTAISIDASQAVSFTNSPTVTGGTANGVAYLNGSKVLTTGTALVFDGTNLGVGTSSPASKLQAYAGTGVGASHATFGASATGYWNFNSGGASSDRVLVRGYNSTGTEIIRLDPASDSFINGGNLGIGVTSPVSRIDARAASAVIGNYQTIQASSTDSAAVDLGGGIGLGGYYSGTSLYATFGNIVGRKENGTSGNYAGYLAFGTNAQATGVVERMRIDSSGNLLVGTTSGANHIINRTITAGTILTVKSNGTGSVDTAYFNYCNATGTNLVTEAGFYVQKHSTSGRSINAAGTINASGADYAEYMTKAGNFTVAKGDVVGIDENGKLTNVFADAISFVVKSTDPSYVGGDTWGSEESVGMKKPNDDATQEKKDAYKSAIEAARQRVDRIAFAGQVPVNVMGATAGQYIIPVNDNGAIKGEAVSNPTFEQYQIAVGKVIAIESDGRAKIIVKVA